MCKRPLPSFLVLVVNAHGRLIGTIKYVLASTAIIHQRATSGYQHTLASREAS